MLKKIIILVVLLLFYLIGAYSIISDSNLSKNIKNSILNDIKPILKDTIFIIPTMRKENLNIIKKLEILDKEIASLKINNDQVLGLRVYDDPLNVVASPLEYKLAKFFLTGEPHNYKGNIKNRTNYKGRYIEKFKDNLIIFDTLKFYTTSTVNDDIFRSEKIELRKISTNIDKFKYLIGIRDMKVIKDKIFLFAIFKDDKNPGYYFIEILTSKLDFNKSNSEFNKIVFEKFLKFDFKSKNIIQSGGRIDEFKKNQIIVSFGDFSKPKWDSKEVELFSDNNYAGKIISINLENKDINILSKGHRNPQGLIYLKEKNIIINTEHGPKGGDEVNINYLDKIYNFGWPLASYGTRYNGDDPFPENHKNFEEPIRHYSPSVAPSQIIPKFNSEFFYMASLKEATIYKLRFIKNFTNINFERRIVIGERIRDIIYVGNNIYALVLDNTPSIAFFKEQDW